MPSQRTPPVQKHAASSAAATSCSRSITAQGWSIAQIARRLERAPSTVRGYLHDPAGEKAAARKASYAGRCECCGALTSGADGKGRAARHCQPQSQPRWTREAVRGAHHFWLERFGFVASPVDWSGTHARRRGGTALARYASARWPSRAVIRRLYGSRAAARADAFKGSDGGRDRRSARRSRRTRADQDRSAPIIVPYPAIVPASWPSDCLIPPGTEPASSVLGGASSDAADQASMEVDKPR